MRAVENENREPDESEREREKDACLDGLEGPEAVGWLECLEHLVAVRGDATGRVGARR